MEKRLSIVIDKQEESTSNPSQDINQAQDSHNRYNEIIQICQQLSQSSQTFEKSIVYNMIEKYISQYKRWMYSDISGYLFNCQESVVSSFISNLDQLQIYAHGKSNENMVTAIDKLWDHSNLAQKQNASLHDSDETFKARFDKNLIPFKATFAHEMNMQFISLIAIFTALSFIVFGGISSLDNILSGAVNIPILQLMIIGCIWSFFISNLVFVFMFFVSKLTHIPIKSCEEESAPLNRKYPLIIWYNFILLFILVVSCWLYYIDYSNSGGWLLSFSHKHEIVSSIGGSIIIGIFFAAIAITFFKNPKIMQSADRESKDKNDH
ncbi:MAG: hypothetical protein HFG17_10700 [Oscillospiraceae bacterium]|nr:hypothetical protein [Oscillospiraceae bacterium]